MPAVRELGLFSFPFLIRFWLTSTGRRGFLTAPDPRKRPAKPDNFLKLNDPIRELIAQHVAKDSPQAEQSS